MLLQSVLLSSAPASVGRADASSIKKAMLGDKISIRAKGTGGPWVSLEDGRDLFASYNGPASLVGQLESNEARPLSLASADYDEDGVADLVSAYATEAGGIVSLYRGNVDSIYPNSVEAKRRKAAGAFTDAPFLSPARVVGVGGRPDFIGTGDFDNDGHWDVATAQRGDSLLRLMSGDGRGGLRQSRSLELDGVVTAMASGEVNRRDGLDDIVIAVTGANGSRLLVFEGADGAMKAEPERIELPSEATSIALGEADGGYEMDIAVAAGREVILVHGRDRQTWVSGQATGRAKVSRREFESEVVSVAIGRFTSDQHVSIAALTADGSLQVLDGVRIGAVTTQQADIHQWQSREVFRLERDVKSQQASSSRSPQLIKARVSSTPVDNIVVMDEAERLHVVVAGDEQSRGFDTQSGRVEAASLDVEGEPAAVLPMRLNSDALNDLVVLRDGAVTPSITKTRAQSIFEVSNTGDSGPGSLRQAILDSNQSPGLDSISFNIPADVPTIRPAGQLPTITDAVLIDGTSQPGGKVEMDGSGAGVATGLIIVSGNSLARGLVINRFLEENPDGGPGQGLLLITQGSNIIEDNLIGTDKAGTSALGNRREGILIFSGNNTIGGTAAAARNVISGNRAGLVIVGLTEAGSNAADNIIQGNYIGTDVSGTASIPNTVGGVILLSTNRSVLNNQVGGTIAGAANIVSGNNAGAIGIIGNAFGNRVQGNYVGVNSNNASATGPNPPLLRAAAGDLSISVTDSPRPVASGNRLTYSVRVSNSGPDAATDVEVSTATPVGTTFASVQAAGASVAPPVGSTGSITVVLGSIPSGGSTTFAVVVNVVAAAGSTLSNTVTVNNSAGDPNTANNTATVSTPVQGGGVLTLSWEQLPQSADQPTPAPTNLQVKPGAGIVSTVGNREGIVFFNGASNNFIGGTGSRAGNVIAGNGTEGVLLSEGRGNAVLSNSIFSNQGLAIRMQFGGNDGARPPALTSASSSTIRGTLSSTANASFRVEFFANAACDTSGGGEGETFIGSTDVTTNASGNASFTYVTTVPSGQFITATATDPQGNTSEFSQCVQASSSSQASELSVQRYRVTGEITEGSPLSYVIALTNNTDKSIDSISIRDLLPANTTFESVSSSMELSLSTPSAGRAGAITAGNLSLSAGETLSLMVTARVESRKADDLIAQEAGMMCALVGYNIYISDTSPVQTTPSNLWKSVPATTSTGAPTAPGGSNFKVTTLWSCGGMILESDGSNQVGVPGGPGLRSISASSKLKVKGNGFSTSAEVFLDGIAFTKRANVGGSQIKQKGTLTDGRAIRDAVTAGKTVLVSVRNANSGISSLSYTKQ